MTLENLPEIFELFGYGLIVGGLMTGIVWAVGYGIKAFIGFLQKA